MIRSLSQTYKRYTSKCMDSVLITCMYWCWGANGWLNDPNPNKPYAAQENKHVCMLRSFPCFWLHLPQLKIYVQCHPQVFRLLSRVVVALERVSCQINPRRSVVQIVRLVSVISLELNQVKISSAYPTANVRRQHVVLRPFNSLYRKRTVLPIYCAAIRYALGICPALRPPATSAMLAPLAVTTGETCGSYKIRQSPGKEGPLMYSSPRKLYVWERNCDHFSFQICIPLPYAAVFPASHNRLAFINQPSPRTMRFAIAVSSQSQYTDPLLLQR